jgi:hypothetical protein
MVAQNGLIALNRAVLECGRNVARFEMRIGGEDLIRSRSRSEEFENMRYADAEAAKARPTAALFEVYGYPMQFAHRRFS